MKLETSVLDISGYSFSGKSAVYDLIASYETASTHGVEFEFDLIRARGGILDLCDSLAINWNIVRSSVAIRDFRRLTYFLGGEGTIADRIFRGGPQYGRIFKDFDLLVSDYLKQITFDSWSGYWPFLDFVEHPAVVFSNKVISKAIKRRQPVYLSRFTESEFISITQRFLDRLATSGLKSGSHLLVLNNCCDPSSPKKSLRYFMLGKSIVVDRDPRDIYLSAVTAQNSQVGSAAIGHSVDNFISRFRVLRRGSEGISSRVLRLSFEELVLNFDDTKNRIEDFIGNEYLGSRSISQLLFDPDRSRNNICQWRNDELFHRYGRDISIIETKLRDYLTL